jgi:hypothetical protein
MDLSTLTRDRVFRTSDALALGFHTRQLRTLAREGGCTSLTRGWWAVGVPTDELDQHRLTATALQRHFAGRAWLSHYSALVAHRLPADGADLARVHLTRTSDRQSRRQPAFTLHPALGIAVDDTTRLSIALVQTGAVCDPFAALCAADAALHRGLVTVDSLADACERTARHPGTSRTRAVLAHADGLHESPGETRLAAVMRQLGIAATPQVRLSGDGWAYRVDLLLDGAPVVIEFDGKVKYGPARMSLPRRSGRIGSGAGGMRSSG